MECREDRRRELRPLPAPRPTLSRPTYPENFGADRPRGRPQRVLLLKHLPTPRNRPRRPRRAPSPSDRWPAGKQPRLAAGALSSLFGESDSAPSALTKANGTRRLPRTPLDLSHPRRPSDFDSPDRVSPAATLRFAWTVSKALVCRTLTGHEGHSPSLF